MSTNKLKPRDRVPFGEDKCNDICVFLFGLSKVVFLEDVWKNFQQYWMSLVGEIWAMNLTEIEANSCLKKHVFILRTVNSTRPPCISDVKSILIAQSVRNFTLSSSCETKPPFLLISGNDNEQLERFLAG